MNKNRWKIKVAAWIGTAIAVSVAIYITGSAWCLWALFIPMME